MSKERLGMMDKGITVRVHDRNELNATVMVFSPGSKDFTFSVENTLADAYIQILKAGCKAHGIPFREGGIPYPPGQEHEDHVGKVLECLNKLRK
ncbi:MAG: hypothetical protein ACXABY_01480 [Candidatus Thorarchaeota archaeon]|jgi:hypothetical protein